MNALAPPALKKLTLSGLPVFLAGLVIAVPVLATFLAGIWDGGGPVWDHIQDNLLSRYTAGTLGMLALTAVFTLLMGVPTAWCVTMYDFPGRPVFEWLLILPLAAPGYVLAYAYGDMMGVMGPWQMGLRELTGWSARDYWFPNINSLPGLAFVLSCGLFPYVYLTARAAFVSQSVCALEAARSLGAGAGTRFFRVALPAARPTIMAGLALALMEAAADYGAAEFLGVPTLTFGIVRAWKSFGDADVAARLAIFLVLIGVTLLMAERWSRGRARVQQSSSRWREVARETPGRAGAMGAFAYCATIFLLAFVLPIGHLVRRSFEVNEYIAPVWQAFGNTLILAGAGACAGFVLALIISLSFRSTSWIAQAARLSASSAYAVPGAVLALGALVALSMLGMTLTGLGALFALAWVYASRFTASGAEPMIAALSRAPASLGQAAQSLGASPWRRAREVDLPIALSGALAGALILFVESLKELPATLMLRPFNWDTLSVRAHAYATDERLAAAALPSLLITLAGLIPVIVLSWRLSRARPGSDR